MRKYQKLSIVIQCLAYIIKIDLYTNHFTDFPIFTEKNNGTICSKDRKSIDARYFAAWNVDFINIIPELDQQSINTYADIKEIKNI